MALGPVTLTADLHSSGRWIVLYVEATGMTQVTIYRLTSDGSVAVRGAYQKEVSGSLNAADYEAPQNTTITYYATATDGVMTRDSDPVVLDGMMDRGGDVLFGMGNPLALIPVEVIAVGDMKAPIRQDVVRVVGRPDPVVVSDVRGFPAGTLTVATATDSERLALAALLADGGVVAFSPHDGTFGFADVWYLSIGDVTERRVSSYGGQSDRFHDLPFQRVAPPPADFIGPAFTTWDDVNGAGFTWNTLLTSGTTWNRIQVA